ncbi:sigma-70 family RNA polymerase sigma factor [Leucobacter luti]|uniref:RNA polymerase sigma factor (Sigma-70 family) n=1 Tax=Leucobacter luti TaxID=340320 RepID=A0A4Q7TKC7_9MICO|nr:sigma-70 family RNA polymerase sigma factor [Leucobacter luti]RZT61064.1 RNA polymerase sigma factor (sigma-70 family) [Leucobacter luti]
MESVGRVFAESGPRLLTYLRGLGATVDEAEEARAAAFEVLIAAVRAGNPPHTNPEGFVYTVAKRQLYAQWARQGREAPLTEEVSDTAEVQDAAVVTELEHALAIRAFASLAPEKRLLLWRVLGEGGSQRELARELGMSDATLRKRVSRYRREFRERYLLEYASGEVPDRCRPTMQILIRHAIGSTTPRQAARLDEHLATCDRCTRVLRDVRDEVGLVHRSYALLPVPVLLALGAGGGAITGVAAAPGPAAAAPGPAAAAHTPLQGSLASGLGRFAAVVGRSLAATGAVLGSIAVLAPIVTVLLAPIAPSVSEQWRPGVLGEAESEPSAVEPGSEAGRDSPGSDLPEVAHRAMPAPGETVAWRVEIARLSSDPDAELEITVSTQLSQSTDSAYLTLRLGAETLVDELPLGGAGETVIRAPAGPASVQWVDVSVSRPAADTDQSLAGSVSIGASVLVPPARASNTSRTSETASGSATPSEIIRSANSRAAARAGPSPPAWMVTNVPALPRPSTSPSSSSAR